MAASPQSTLEDIERRRVQLQQNVDKLRKALHHWTTWEAEYDIFKEEIQNAGNPSPSQMRDIARHLECSLVDQKEVEELLCTKSSSERTANQVVDTLSRRIDYVRTSSTTIERQLDVAEKQLAGVDVLLEPGMDNEDGDPMMDIEEELDEDGNEVSSAVNQTGRSVAELVEVLRKAGIQKAELEKKSAAPEQDEPSDTPKTAEPDTRAVEVNAAAPLPVTSSLTPSSSDTPASASQQKSVSFADDVDIAPSKTSGSEKDVHHEETSAFNFPEGTAVVELDQDDEPSGPRPIIPEDESPEDAVLRRQMLQYGLSEVGQIVAELDLDRPTASFSDEETDDDYDNYDTEEEDEEDEYGRSTRPVISEEYKKQMTELEKKLGARMLENVGPQSDDDPLAEHVGDIRTMRVRPDGQFDESLNDSPSRPSPSDTKEETKKKGVRFADDLDISEAPKPVQAPAREVLPTAKATPTMSDTIVERSAHAVSLPVEAPKPAKVSRFKSARTGSSQPRQTLPTPPLPETPSAPTGPSGRTLATTITEHSPLPSEPQAPDEFDPITLNREIQAEYHKARNKFIQRQGGFKATEEDEESPIVEERNGRSKKVSRFIAARLKADGM